MTRKIFQICLMLCFGLLPIESIGQFEKTKTCKAIVVDYWENGVVLGIDRIDITVTAIAYSKDKDIYRVSGYVNSEYYSTSVDDGDTSSSLGFTVKKSSDSVIYYNPVNRYGLFTLFIKQGEYAEIGDYWVTKIAIECNPQN